MLKEILIVSFFSSFLGNRTDTSLKACALFLQGKRREKDLIRAVPVQTVNPAFPFQCTAGSSCYLI